MSPRAQLVLVPGAMLEVVSVLSQGALTMVQLVEVDTPLSLCDFPPKPAAQPADAWHHGGGKRGGGILSSLTLFLFPWVCILACWFLQLLGGALMRVCSITIISLSLCFVFSVNAIHMRPLHPLSSQAPTLPLPLPLPLPRSPPNARPPLCAPNSTH